MKGPFSVILEVPGQAPRVYATLRSHVGASALAWKVAEGYPGAKVYLRSPGSSDQLQITSKGGVVRDQPGLPAFGQDVFVHVPTATATIKGAR